MRKKEKRSTGDTVQILFFFSLYVSSVGGKRKFSAQFSRKTTAALEDSKVEEISHRTLSTDPLNGGITSELSAFFARSQDTSRVRQQSS